MSYQQDFIKLIAPAAARLQKSKGLPAAALVAQICLETGYGQRICKDKRTGKDSKNLFNIKGKGPAGSVIVNTKEYINGHWITIEAAFRAYNSFDESFNDFAALMAKPRYALARAQTDPYKFADQLQRAGYATDPYYASKIAGIIKGQNIEKILEGYLVEQPRPKPAPAPWAVAAIEKVKAAGIMSGDPDGYFRPKEPITREEIALVVARLLDRK